MEILNRRLSFKKGEKIYIAVKGNVRTPRFALWNDDGHILDKIPKYENDILSVELDELDVGLYFFFIGDDDENVSEQITVYQNEYSAPEFLRDGAIYHVFVDRFNKGGSFIPRDDSVYRNDWYDSIPMFPEKPGDPIANNEFFGGTLYGVVEKLDYIKSLGVKCIYLSPIFEAYSNHKYDTGDYMTVDDAFGGDEALQLLINEAKKRGIGIMLDGVFNHTGDNSIYFNRYGRYDTVGAYSSKESPYYDWYFFDEHPDVYECWWGVKILPKIRPVEAFRKYICEEVLEKYCKMGVMGWRLDVVDELDDEFLCRIAKTVKKYGCYLLGEVWEDGSNKIAYGNRRHYFHGKQLDGVMNYPLREGLIDYLIWKNSELLKNTAKTLILHYPPDAERYTMSMLGTHDTERILTVLGGEFSGEKTNRELSTMKMTESEREFGKKLLKCGYLILFSLFGTPCIYYGDEAGLEGYRDPFNRRPYPWGREEKDLIEHVQKLGALRNDGIFSGETEILETGEKSFCYKKGESLILTNMDETEMKLSLDGSYIDLLDGSLYHGEVFVPAFSGRCLVKYK